MEQHFRSRDSICPICNEEIQNFIIKPCGHRSCLNCFYKNEALKGNFGGSCSSCIICKEINEPLQTLQAMPLQLISVEKNGLLGINKTALLRCFLSGGIGKYPVFLISVIGERRTGKSFLMNYIMKALQNQERTNTFGLGAEDEILKGFTWKPGPDTVTNGIWIWSKPFILERNGQEIAVFLMDMEGSMDIDAERKSNIKMCMLSMLLSSHLVYNVRSNIKETDVDYLEIYCHGLGSDKLHNLKYFDFLIRDWYHPEKCGDNHGASYFEDINKTMKTRYKNCTFLEVLARCSSKCFLMPHPGSKITCEEKGRLIDMNKEFQESLRRYLSDVVDRVLLSIGSAENTLTCSDMAQKIITEFLPYINKMKYNISSPSEMYNMKKNLETMQEIKNDFQDFLNNWPIWKIRIGNQVADKISELYEKFQTSSRRINEEDHNEQLEMLRTYLITEGDKFCRRHNIKLGVNGIAVLTGVAAVPLVGVFAAAPEAAVAGPVAFQNILGWAWAGAQAAAQVGVAVVRRFI